MYSTSNILWITGLPGSGKTKCAEDYADHNTIVIHLDAYFDPVFQDQQTFVFTDYLDRIAANSDWRWYYTHPGFECRAPSNQLISDIYSFGSEMYKRGKKVIVEGFQIADGSLCSNLSLYGIYRDPLIVVESNPFVAYYRRCKRDKVSMVPMSFSEVKLYHEFYKKIHDGLKELKICMVRR